MDKSSYNIVRPPAPEKKKTWVCFGSQLFKKVILTHVGQTSETPAWFAWFSDKWKGSTFPLGGGASIGPSCEEKKGELIERQKTKCVHFKYLNVCTYTYDHDT